ncbi:MAG: adenylate/guanylate cyclase domain-containing protein [Hyphomicrobiales bacterium]
MKRKVGLFLFAVMLLVTLGATLVVSLAMYRLVSARQAQEIAGIEMGLSERFEVFEDMLRSQHHLVKTHMETVLPQIAADITAMQAVPETLTKQQMEALTKKYGVEHIYFINRDHRVFQTDLAADLNLQFPTSEFTGFLDTVFDKGEVMSAGIDMSSQTGKLQTYSYFGPRGTDYIVETSTELRPSIERGDFPWMGEYFFDQMFADAVTNNQYLKDVDIFLVTPAATWSLLDVGEKLSPDIVERVAKEDRVEIPSADDDVLTIYSKHVNQDDPEQDPVANKMIIRQVSYDIGLARQAVQQVLFSSLAVLLLLLPLVYIIASRLLQRQLLDPLFKLRSQARAIADGDLEQSIADTARRDEIGHLASSFASMRDAVRRTITDLRDTNASIERFVPKPFLTIMGKPSIVSVQLGDNRRRDMTVLFSDIRNFTGLSERMTPDENFAFINSYLERMGPVIRAHNGFIDKYIGDAIMALFEAADDAVRAGLAMLETLDAFNVERQKASLPTIGIGIGLNSGSLMLGTIGERDRMDGTVISDAVNLAARIESLTKTYKVSLLITQNTYNQLSASRAFSIRPIDIVVVKGKTEAVAIYEVYDHNPVAEREAKEFTRDLLQSGVEALAKGDTTVARQLFTRSLTLLPGDPAATNLLKCCGEVG